tara:strand:+ start:474 stop:677 length:204 start_codon:yes stop_codon:yes gene_type:complete
MSSPKAPVIPPPPPPPPPPVKMSTNVVNKEVKKRAGGTVRRGAGALTVRRAPSVNMGSEGSGVNVQY